MVQSETFAILIDQILCNLRTCNTLRPSQLFFEKHHGAEDDTDKLEEEFDNDFHTRF